MAGCHLNWTKGFLPALALAIPVVAMGCGPNCAKPTVSPQSTDTTALIAPIELRDTQVGFAGRSGTLTVIDPDGRYRVSRFLEDRVDPPHSVGTLAAGDLNQLLAILKRSQLETLPEKMGEKPPVNPHLVEIRFREHQSLMVLQPGQSVAEARAGFGDRPEAPEARLLALVDEIVRLTDARAQD